MGDELVKVAKGGETLDVHSSCVAAHVAAGWRVVDVEVADEAAAPAPAVDGGVLTVAKGPRGLWYVMQGDKRVSRGFETEESALEAATADQNAV